MKRIYLLTSVVLVLAFLQFGYGPDLRAASVDPKSLVGKSENEISDMLGKPIGRIEMGDDLTLTFSSMTVSFKEGKVFKAAAFSPTTTPAPAPIPAQQPSTPKQEASLDVSSDPMDLKFTAVDGTEIDLSQFRGKVVLIDFWATWCGPCVGEVPHVVETYKKYHSQGFEIVGISLDQKKESLLSFIQKNEMVWPQYFDGQGWHNKISSQYGIRAIPAMWLIDKQGKVVSKNARQGLADQVAKLL
jgi:thiol-disulfide isomerase/thioredoxin